MNMIKKNILNFGTKEWADSNENFISGCKHNCKYCYAKEMAIRFNRKSYNNWNIEEIRLKDLNKHIKKRNGIIMFPSSHDIHPDNLEHSLSFIKKLLDAGNNILIVSKPHLICIKNICINLKQYKDHLTFRFTIGSSNSEVLKFWEPDAPSFDERFRSLKYAYNKGFKTSVSCEPMLDANIDKLIDKVLPYVNDSIWIGKVNFLVRRLKMNNEYDSITKLKAEELINIQSDFNIIQLYNKYKENNMIKWKESVMKIVYDQ